MKHARIATLSGGERNRVLIAKLLCAGGNVLVLDEPTNDLDLASLRALEDALLAFPGAAIVVSHDRWFLDRVATRVVHLDGSGAARVHEGDLSLLLERLRAATLDRARSAAVRRAEARWELARRLADGDEPDGLLDARRRRTSTGVAHAFAGTVTSDGRDIRRRRV